MKFISKNIEEMICVVLLAGIVVLTTMQIFTRFVLDSPLSWTEELARFLMIWLVFFGASAGIKHKSHIKIELIINKMNDKWKKYLQLATSFIVVILLITLVYQGTLLTINMSALPASTLPFTWAYVYSAVPVGCTFMLLRIFQYKTI